MKDRCSCNDWKENIDIINAPYKMHLSAIGQYEGKVFENCPWCGLPLVGGIKDKMKEYKVPVDWQVYGEIYVTARSLEEAIERIENDDETPFPTDYYNVDSSLEVNYDQAQVNYPDEEIGNEPIHAKGSLTCPECGGKLGKHMLSCSTIGGHL